MIVAHRTKEGLEAASFKCCGSDGIALCAASPTHVILTDLAEFRGTAFCTDHLGSGIVAYLARTELA